MAKAKLKRKHDPVALRTYNAKDCVSQYLLYPRYLQRLANVHNGEELFQLYTNKLQPIGDRMTYRGVKIDAQRRKKLHHGLRTRIGKAEAELAYIADKTHFGNLNPRSHMQLKDFFFEHLGAVPSKWSEETGEPSLDESVLSGYVTSADPLIKRSAEVLLRIRRWSTIDNTHVRGLSFRPKHNTVHPFWRPGGAQTGRWSSASPNVMAIPKPVREPVLDEQGRQKFDREGLPRSRQTHPGLRGMYIPHDPEKGWWVEADYAQIELRIVALLAQDDVYLRMFELGHDPHSANTWDLFYPPQGRPDPVTKAHVTKKERTLAKNFVYLAHYLGKEKKLWETLRPTAPDFTLSKAKRLLKKYWRMHPKIQAWQEELLATASSLGVVEEPLSGKVRDFWGRISPNEVANFPIQTAAGHIINKAIQTVAEQVNWETNGICFQYHDAIMLDGLDPYRLACILQEGMTVTVELGGAKATFPIDISVGKRWGTSVEIADVERLKSRKFLQTLAKDTA